MIYFYKINKRTNHGAYQKLTEGRADKTGPIFGGYFVLVQMENGLELAKNNAGTVVKSNVLIQKSRFELSLLEQRIVLYLISQISFGDNEFKTYELPIGEFSHICGQRGGGRDYTEIKDTIKGLADKSIWVELQTGEEALIRWIETPSIDALTGKIRLCLNQHMKPYLLDLKRNFTQYELGYTLRFRSKYSIRFYEYIKSIHYNETVPYHAVCAIEDLRVILGIVKDADKVAYKYLKRRMLDVAVREINTYSDKHVEYEEVKVNRRVVEIKIYIRTKNARERIALESQLSAEERNNK